jgi:hypothetical protein
MHSRCDKQNEISMHMMSCSSFSASNTIGVKEMGERERETVARLASSIHREV